MFGWEAGFDSNLLLGIFRKMRTVGADGRCGFVGSDYKFWKPVLYSSIRASAEVGLLKRRCIDKALSDATLDLSDPTEFLGRCTSAFQTLKQNNTQTFVVLCDVTYDGPDLLREVKDGECTILWNPSSSSRFMKRALSERSKFAAALKRDNIPSDVPGLTNILVKVAAANQFDAHTLAIDAVDRLRGVLNLMVNSGRGLNLFQFHHISHAINRFRLGPYRTVHNPDGTSAGETFWYEPRWEHKHKSAKFAEDAKAVRQNILHWRRLATRNPLSEFIGDGLLRYCRALDQHDTDAVLVGLWGTIEYLTATQTEKYDVTVSRVSKLFKDTPETRQIAQHIRLRRNSTIHAGKSPDNDEADAVLLHADALAAQLLFFYITNRPGFKDRDELIRFLDLNLNEKTLIRDRKLIDRFIRYRNRKTPSGK